jgi:hypothetical protein
MDPQATAAAEQFLVELAQWLARVQQYSIHHPACAQLGEKAVRTLERVLYTEQILSIGVLKNAVTLAPGTESNHPAVRGRMGPHLHERGVLMLRFVRGVNQGDLTALVELLTLTAQDTFDRGGLSKLLHDRGVLRVEIDEIALEVTAEEREARKQREQISSFLLEAIRQLLAFRRVGDIGEQLMQLLDHPEIAIAILEEDPLGVAEAVAGLCMMVREEEKKTGKPLLAKLLVIVNGLSSRSHAHIISGLPPLVGDFRGALVWALEGLGEDELARVVLPALLEHAPDLDVPLYAIGLAAPHVGRRLSMLRRVALLFYDLPVGEERAESLLQAAAQPVEDYESNRLERDCMQAHAARVLLRKVTFGAREDEPLPAPPAELGQAEAQSPPLDAGRVMLELVAMSSRTRHFGQLCRKLPTAAATLTAAGSSDAVVGVLRGLANVQQPEHLEVARATLRQLATPEVVAPLLGALETASDSMDATELDEIVTNVKLLVVLSPVAVFEQLDRSESRKMRRILLDALQQGGPDLAPLARERLESPKWFVVRNAVILLARVGGTPADLVSAARHPNERVRHEVARALRLMPADVHTMEIVAHYLTDPVQDIRKFVVPMLRGDLANETTIETLALAANDEQLPEDVRLRVIDALGRSVENKAASALYDLIQPKGLIELGNVREYAAVALRRSRAPSAKAYFETALRSPAWRVRKACEKAAAGD